MLKNIGLRIEEVILACLILANILDFFEILPGDVVYIKNILSITAMAYLLYRVSLTRVFFGKRAGETDLVIVLAYVLLIANKLIVYAWVAIEETKYLEELYRAIIDNSVFIETYSFYIGGILLVLLSGYIACCLEIKKPSLANVFGEKGFSRGFWKKSARFLKVFIILVSFFIIVFNLIIEWLAIVLDAPLVVFGTFFYILIIVRRVHSYEPETLLYRLGAIGEDFYKTAIAMFHSKSSLMLILPGILVLHLLTDIGNFIVPYIFGIRDVLYFNQLGIAEHLSLYTLIKADFGMVSGFADKLSLVWIYVFNVIAMLFLLLMPAFIWYTIYKKKGFKVPMPLLALFYASLVCLVSAPVFGIRGISAERLVGVDIWTSGILSSSPDLNIRLIAIISAAVGCLAYAGSYFLKKRLEALAIAISLLFFGLYVLYYFFINTYFYYIGMARMLFSTSQVFLGLYFTIFAAIILIFYVSAFIIYLSETVNGLRYMD